MSKVHRIVLGLLFVLVTVHSATAVQGQPAPRTMRLDYYHSGNSTQELFSLERVVVEPLAWPGNLQKAIDDTNLGKYFFEVRDMNTNRVVYSRGFASIYGEWETTEEAKHLNRTFQESLRFPAPSGRVQVLVKKRDGGNAFREAWSVIVDPADIFVDTSKRASPGPLIEFQKSGDSATKVDFLILCDGYTAAERTKFERDARRLLEVMFTTSPYQEHRSDFNVWGLCPAAAESGISRPSTGIHLASPLGASYDAFGSERYILTFDNRAFREAAQFAPYEFVEIVTNSRTYGGGGIFGLYGTVAADTDQAPYIFVHEFGHHFAGLADEYFTSSVAYLPAAAPTEPWEPNVTALLDPANLKWKGLVREGTPVPTPWEKDEFEKHAIEYQKRRTQIRANQRPEEEMEALFRENRDFEVQLFAKEQYRTRVGAFEGANYEPKGYYRPEIDCIMFTRSHDFCAVCRRAIERVISLYL